MRLSGVTTDDLIKAAALPSSTPGSAPGSAPLPSAEVINDRAGGLIEGYAEGGVTNKPEPMRKYSLADFGISTPDTAIFSYKAGEMYTPLKGIEAAVYANMTPTERDYYLKEMMVRQGRTGAEYFPASQFKRVERYAEGGDVGRGLGSIAMKGYAEELRKQGRNGDTILAHINPEEAQILQALGGSGTINPATGLPEFSFWKKLLKAAQFILPFIPGIGIPAKIGLSALAGGFSGPKKGFDLKRALISGATTYLGGKIGEGLQAAAGVS